MPAEIFKKSPLAAAITVALAGGSAYGEEGQAAPGTGATTIEEIVVVGIRQSLKRSMDLKRNRDGVVDAITAEDIGDFPDSNLAESLQRITGVSIDRERGEGARVTVRGFGPDFNLVLLNGRQMPTTSGLGRSFDFGDLASEGISAVEVYKSGQADVPTGGIGSTINIRTTRPLDAPGMSFTAAVSGLNDHSTEQGDDFTPEVSALVLEHLRRRHRGHCPERGPAGPQQRRQHGERGRMAHLPRRGGQLLVRRGALGMGRHPAGGRSQPAEPSRCGGPLLRAAKHRLRTGRVRARPHERAAHPAMGTDARLRGHVGLHPFGSRVGALLQQPVRMVQLRRSGDGLERRPAGVADGVHRELGQQRLLHGCGAGCLANGEWFDRAQPDVGRDRSGDPSSSTITTRPRNGRRRAASATPRSCPWPRSAATRPPVTSASTCPSSN